MTDVRNTLLLCLLVALVSSFALDGLASSSEDRSTFAALVRIVPHGTDSEETDEARRKRLRPIASAIDSATESLDERAWLIMTARRESGLAAFVTEDGPACRLGKGGRCDSGRAFGAWQLHGMRRTETVDEQAAKAILLFRRSANYCRAQGADYWTGGTSAYATGRECYWAEAGERVAEMRAVRGRL